jgi:NitT/TauT family transport system permease protein
MSVAYEKGDRLAVLAAIVAMVLVIVLTDQLLWRPLVVWSQKFKVEDTEAGEAPRSWALSLVRRSRTLRAIRARERVPVAGAVGTLPPIVRRPAPPPRRTGKLVSALGWGVATVLGAASAYGAWRLGRLLLACPPGRWLEILEALGLTSLRTVVALALGAAWTIPVGVAIGLSPRIARRALPVVQVLASFPAPMLFPLLSDVLVERLGLPFPIACTLLALFGAQWYVLFNVIAGAMSIPTDLREVASVTRSTGLRRWRRLYLPGVFPHLLTGLITAAGGAWNAAIVTEYQKIGDRLLTARGLGALISEATDAGDYRLLAASVLVLTLTLVVLNRFVWKKLYRFSDERFALNR